MRISHRPNWAASPEEVDIVLNKVDGEFVIAPRGRLVGASSILADVSKAMETALKQWRGVALDVSKVETLDNSGLGLIVRSYATAREKGVSFRLINPTERVREILRITRLDQVIPISSDPVKECVQACEAGGG
jgi:anti-sigma B factor antagonist